MAQGPVGLLFLCCCGPRASAPSRNLRAMSWSEDEAKERKKSGKATHADQLILARASMFGVGLVMATIFPGSWAGVGLDPAPGACKIHGGCALGPSPTMAVTRHAKPRYQVPTPLPVNPPTGTRTIVHSGV